MLSAVKQLIAKIQALILVLGFKVKIATMRAMLVPFIGLKAALEIDTEDVVVLFLVFILGGATLPTAFSQWFNSSTAGWPTATSTIYMLGPLFGVIALIMLLVQRRRQG
jgi:hypothetical protein